MGLAGFAAVVMLVGATSVAAFAVAPPGKPAGGVASASPAAGPAAATASPSPKPSVSPSPKSPASPSPKPSAAVVQGTPPCTLHALAKMQGAFGTSTQPAPLTFYSYAYSAVDRGSAPVTVTVASDAKTTATYLAWLHANQAFALVKLECPTGSISLENAVVTAVHVSSSSALPSTVTFSDQTVFEK